MNTPRLEIDLEKIQHNAHTLVERMSELGISVTAITKSILGSPEISAALLRGGITSLGDSRIENIEKMRKAQIEVPMTLIRSPMFSQVDRIVAHTDISLNTELDVIRKLSAVADKTGRSHGIILMVELGDLREGIMPKNLEMVVHKTLSLPGIILKGIGTNLACQSGVSPDDNNMSQLSELANTLESTFSLNLEIVSGGNSANLDWVLNSKNLGRINNLRLGESILLGLETLHRLPIDGLHTDAIKLVAEVIESNIKPSQPWGKFAQNAFGEKAMFTDRGYISQSILAIGRQDIDPKGLNPPPGIKIIGASSDHLIIQSNYNGLAIGTEISFQINYSSLMRAMTSPFVAKEMKRKSF